MVAEGRIADLRPGAYELTLGVGKSCSLVEVGRSKAVINVEDADASRSL